MSLNWFVLVAQLVRASVL